MLYTACDVVYVHKGEKTVLNAKNFGQHSVFKMLPQASNRINVIIQHNRVDCVYYKVQNIFVKNAQWCMSVCFPP